MGTGSGNRCGGGSGCLDAAAGGGECACGGAGSPVVPGFSAHGYLSAMNGMVGLSCGHQRVVGAGGVNGSRVIGSGANGSGVNGSRVNGGAMNAARVNSGTFDGFQMPVGLSARPEGRAGHFGGDPRDTVRLGSPGEVAAAIPHFFGFHPDSSVVVLGLFRSDLDCRAAISHGMRVDLEVVQRSPAAFGRWMAGRLVETGANEALCVVYPPYGGPVRMADYRRLVAGMCAPLRLARVSPLDVLFVSEGRWWSFLCDRSHCCPPEGSPIDTGASAIAVLTAYSGLAVLPNRAALAAGLEPYGAEMADRMRAACDDALNRLVGARVPEADGDECALDFDWGEVSRLWQLADSLCDAQVPLDRALTDEVAGELLVGLTDVRVRDHLATWCGDDRAGQAVALGVELARRAVTPDQAAAAYAIAAWATWSLGWGAWSRLCIERAVTAVPGYALAGLIKQGLDRGIGPEMVREAARGTSRRLTEMRAEQLGTKAA